MNRSGQKGVGAEGMRPPGAPVYRTVLGAPLWGPPGHCGGTNRGVDRHYPLLPVQELGSLPVGRLAAEDARLWIRATKTGLVPARQDSEMPEEKYSEIECSLPGPYLESFTRRTRPGWQVRGNHVDADVALGPEVQP